LEETQRSYPQQAVALVVSQRDLPPVDLPRTLAIHIERAASRPKPPALCYLGARTTGEGREYALRVTGAIEPRVFRLLITHEAFASRLTRFQDAPDLCFGKLQRELAADPDLQSVQPLVLTVQDLAEYRDAHEKRPEARKRNRPPA
jgi:hypothetical protein